MLDNEPGEQSQVAVDMPHSKGSRIAAVGTLFNEVWDTLQGKSAKPGSAVERQMQRFVTSLGADNFERRERTRELLEEAGTLAIPILRRAVRDPDLQTRRTGEQLLEKLLDERFPPYTSLADWRRSCLRRLLRKYSDTESAKNYNENLTPCFARRWVRTRKGRRRDREHRGCALGNRSHLGSSANFLVGMVHALNAHERGRSLAWRGN